MIWGKGSLPKTDSFLRVGKSSIVARDDDDDDDEYDEYDEMERREKFSAGGGTAWHRACA